MIAQKAKTFCVTMPCKHNGDHKTLLQVTIPCVVWTALRNAKIPEEDVYENAKVNLDLPFWASIHSYCECRMTDWGINHDQSQKFDTCLFGKTLPGVKYTLIAYVNIWMFDRSHGVFVTPFWWHFQHLLLCHFRRQKLLLKKSKNNHCLVKQFWWSFQQIL